jgi:S1-C subfamily serine protease
MKTQSVAACAALAWLAAAAPVTAQETDAATGNEQRSLKLEEAQRRLEEAAREVAELSMQLSGPVIEEIRRIRIDGHGRAMLGINLGNADPGVNGARVVSVSPGGPAAEAGVLAGDLVVAVNGQQLGSGRDLVAHMRGVKPGEKVDLDLRREGKPVKVVVIARPRDELLFAGEPGVHGGVMAGMPLMPHFLAGPFGDAELVSMTPGLGRYFGTDRGLLVVRAPEEAGAGLEDGDVILAIGGREPQDPGHAMRILGSYQPGETVELKVLRQKKQQTLRLPVPDLPEERRHRRMMAPPAPPAPPAG